MKTRHRHSYPRWIQSLPHLSCCRPSGATLGPSCKPTVSGSIPSFSSADLPVVSVLFTLPNMPSRLALTNWALNPRVHAWALPSSLPLPKVVLLFFRAHAGLPLSFMAPSFYRANGYPFI
jgi:hypothetical protein